MYIYILYIELLHIQIQTSIKGIKCGDKYLKMCGYVEDNTIFIENQDDFQQINTILKDCKNKTNSKYNEEKTKLLGIGLI